MQAVFSEWERTREALHAAKKRGVKLGNPDLKKARDKASEVNIRKKEEFCAFIQPILRDMQAHGFNRLIAIADELNARGILTRRGKKWSASTVRLYRNI